MTSSTFASDRTDAICISLYENSFLERAAFAAFSALTCRHYNHHLVITNKPKTEASEISARRIDKIRSFLKRSGQVDIFIFGHTNQASIWFTNIFDTEFFGKVRLVYNSGCTDGQPNDGEAWLKSARAFVGHRGDNYGGKYTPAFLHYWFRGKSLSESVRLSNLKLNKEKYFENGNDPYGYLYGDGSLQYP